MPQEHFITYIGPFTADIPGSIENSVYTADASDSWISEVLDNVGYPVWWEYGRNIRKDQNFPTCSIHRELLGSLFALSLWRSDQPYATGCIGPHYVIGLIA